MKKYLYLILFALLIFSSQPSDALLRGALSVASVVHGWNPLLVGAGGQITNVDYPTTSSPFLTTTDTAGVFGLNKSTGQWAEVLNFNSLPSAFTGDNKWLDGAYDIRSAPSNPAICYLGYNVYNGGENTAHVLKSTNCNNADPTTITFTDLSGFTTACSTGCIWSGSLSAYKFVGPKIGIDPINPSVVIVATPHNGQLVTTDGGASFCALPSVPASTLNSGGFNVPAVGVAFDPTSSTVSTALCGSSPTRTAGVWICSQGNGCWKSTNGSVSFAQQTSGTGPTNVGRAKIGIDGTFYATDYTAQDQNSKLWRFTTTWTDITPPGSVGQDNIASFAIYPSDATKLVVTSASGAQSFLTSANSGTPSYTGTITGSPTRAASDLPWLLAGPSALNYLNMSDVVMDPATSGKVWAASGVGVWYSTSTSGVTAWTAQSKGIAQLVLNKITSPPGGTPVAASWDRPLSNLGNNTAYTTGYGPSYSVSNNISMGWGVDYCTSAPTTVVELDTWADNGISGYSTTNGSPNDPSSWTFYANFPALVGTFIGGSIACSTPDNVVFHTSNNGDVYYSQDATSGSASWTVIPAATFGHGMQQSGAGITTGWGFAYYANRQAVCADRVAANTFFIENYQTGALGGGTYRISFPSGTLTIQQIQSGPIDTGGGTTQLYCVPGNSGHLFFTQGQFGAGLFYTTQGLLTSATFNQISGVTDVYQVTTGAIKSGNDYPSVYINAKVGSTGGPANDGYSIWRSDNSKAQWAAGTVTWTDIGIPLLSIDQVSAMAGDNNTWGVLYAGGKGTGPGWRYDP